jgi:hypothetical protein
MKPLLLLILIGLFAFNGGAALAQTDTPTPVPTPRPTLSGWWIARAQGTPATRAPNAPGSDGLTQDTVVDLIFDIHVSAVNGWRFLKTIGVTSAIIFALSACIGALAFRKLVRDAQSK